MSNAHIFKASLFETYLKGLFGDSKIKNNSSTTGIRISINANFYDSFTLEFYDDSLLDLDFDKLLDDNGNSVEKVLKANSLIGDLSTLIKSHFGGHIEKWWDSDTSIKISDRIEVYMNFTTYEIRILNNNRFVNTGHCKVFKLDTVDFVDVIEYITMLTNFNSEVDDNYNRMTKEFSERYTNLFKERIYNGR